MKLVASMIVRNELGRYLEPCVNHLLEFCDEIVVLDDHSDDGTLNWLQSRGARVQPLRHNSEPEFFKHEGRARQMLLEWTLSRQPTHVLAVDADEFVSNGEELRHRLTVDGRSQAWTLAMEEVWELDGDCLCVREDGGWRTHPVPSAWKVPRVMDATWKIMNRALACGRVPTAVTHRLQQLTAPSGSELLHFGWANQPEREARHHRYAIADGGRYHASAHLDSILWDDARVALRGREWPAALKPYRAAVAAHALQEAPCA